MKVDPVSVTLEDVPKRSRPRLWVGISLGLLGLAAALAACGGGDSDLFAGFDSAEVAYLREDAARNNVELGDEALLGSLRFGRDCRVFFDALEKVEAGESLPDGDIRLLIDRAVQEGSQDLSARYGEILQSAELGDLSQVRDWVDGACFDVPREIPN